jgi:hypothetical protein
MKLKEGAQIRFRPSKMNGHEPATWKNEGRLLKFERDEQLTSMNKRNIEIFRCIVEFEEEPHSPTTKDIEQFSEEGCYIASLLPMLIEAVEHPQKIV